MNVNDNKEIWHLEYMKWMEYQSEQNEKLSLPAARGKHPKSDRKLAKRCSPCL
jgi:hypothetical protein